MGVSLQIAIDKHGLYGFLANNRLYMDVQGDQILHKLKVFATPFSCEVGWYFDDGLKDTTEDNYGFPLTFVTAHQFIKSFAGERLTPWDNAVLAFIRELKPETKILLFWS